MAMFSVGYLVGAQGLEPWTRLIKSQQIALNYQAHFDISSVRSGIEPERKLENVETRFQQHRVARNRHYGDQATQRTL